MIFLIGSFFVTAILYAAVGFGGGSTYGALLVLAETDYRILPAIALLCNLIVVSGGSWRFFRAGHIDFRRIAPWIVTSVPAAWFGGRLEISETFFVGLLGLSLLLAGLKMLVKNKGHLAQNPAAHHILIAPIVGGLLGLLAGLVGIGGGIFLAPVLHMLRWGQAKMIAGTCSLFILVNSLSGLWGQIIKFGDAGLGSDILAYGWLFPAVLIGGQMGSHLGAVRLQPEKVALLTSILILCVALRLLWRWLGMV